MPFSPSRILVPTDFSACARHAADAAVDLAAKFGASLTLCHVVPLSTYTEYVGALEGGGAFTSADMQRVVREGAGKELQREVERLRARGAAVDSVQLDGPAAPEVCAHAKERGFDLIVAGTHGRTGLRRLVLGSVAENIVRHAGCAVLTIHAPADS